MYSTIIHKGEEEKSHYYEIATIFEDHPPGLLRSTFTTNPLKKPIK